NEPHGEFPNAVKLFTLFPARIHTSVSRTAGGGVAANEPGPVWAARHIRRLRAVRSRARAGRPVSESVPADSVRAEPVRAEPVRSEPVRIQPAPRLLCRLCGRT